MQSLKHVHKLYQISVIYFHYSNIISIYFNGYSENLIPISMAAAHIVIHLQHFLLTELM